MELNWLDRRTVHGCDISCHFFEPDRVDPEADFARRMLPMFNWAKPALLVSEGDRQNYVLDPLIAQPDAVLRHGNGLLCLEYKSQSGRQHRPDRWHRDIPCSGVLQLVATSVAVAASTAKTVAPLLRCHNAIYLLRPQRKLVEHLLASVAGAKAYWGETRYVSSSQLAAYCEPRVKTRFGDRDEEQSALSQAGRARHEQMLRR